MKLHDELMNLSLIDDSRQELSDEEAALKKKLFELEESLRKGASEIAELEAREREIALKIRVLEKDEEEIAHSIAKLNEKFYTLKSAKEVESFEQESAKLREKKNAIEEKLLKHMEKQEEIRKKLEQMKGALDALSRITAGESQLLKARLENVRVEQEKLDVIRAKAVESISAPVLSEYERARKSLGKRAVSIIRNRTCSSCGIDIPPSLIVELTLRDRVKRCANCSSLLVLPNEEKIDDKK